MSITKAITAANIPVSEKRKRMYNTKEMDIDGITEDGRVIPVFRKGNFVF